MHRDPHTGDTAVHGAFCRIWRVHGLTGKKSPANGGHGRTSAINATMQGYTETAILILQGCRAVGRKNAVSH
ncbi:MAG: hypothetical protein IJV76_12475, partial [Clostridia bacterium]|nr:hypothetical protein [Clostridia bacterium]